MAPDIVSLGSLLWGTLQLRPYVFVFLLAFLVAAVQDLGPRRAVAFLGWSWGVAFVAEYTSSRVGVPFGLYHYTGHTAGLELYLSNVPLFDSLSFVFLAYAAFCVSRWIVGPRGGVSVVALAGLMMMLLDVVIDPLAVRGDRWFLGPIFYYPAGGVYFGVPLSNFAGWALVGWLIMGGYAATARVDGRVSEGYGRSPGPGVALYGGVLLFNLAMTLWIGEWGLVAAGILLHSLGFLLLYGIGAILAHGPLRIGAAVQHIAGGRGDDFDRTRSYEL